MASLLGDILETTSLEEVVAEQLNGSKPMLHTMADTGVAEVSKLLSDNQISSCPVFDGKECIGIVDFSDIVGFLLKMEWKEEVQDKVKLVDGGEQFWEAFGGIPISKAIDLGRRSPKEVIKASATLREAISFFVEKDLRRALATDDNGNIVAVVSPSQMVKLILKKLEGREDEFLSRTVSQLDLGTGPVISMRKEEKVLAGLHRIHQIGKSVIAVVDEKGQLVASISMSDVKLVFQSKRFSLLVLTAWKFVQLNREIEDNEIFPFFGVTSNSTVNVVLSKMIATKTHHLYTVGSSNLQPEKVISFTDIFAAIDQHL